MIDIRTEIQDRELLTALERLRYRVGSMRPVMAEIAETMRTSVEKNFAAESSRGPLYGGTRGGAWADLAPATKKARERIKKYPGKKLQVTGQLLASITTQSSETEAIVGTNKGYARYLHDGTKRMPARPYMVIQQADLAEFGEIVGDYLMGR